MAGERSDLTPQQMRAFVGRYFYIASEHERAGVKSADYWEGFNAALHLMYGYIMADLDAIPDKELPKPGEIARKVQRTKRAAAR